VAFVDVVTSGLMDEALVAVDDFFGVVNLVEEGLKDFEERSEDFKVEEGLEVVEEGSEEFGVEEVKESEELEVEDLE
jgi:hypothetical protein